MEVDDSLAGLRPPSASRRTSGSRIRRSNHSSRVGSVGLGSWGIITWPVTTAFSIISGVWYLFSTPECSHPNCFSAERNSPHIHPTIFPPSSTSLSSTSFSDFLDLKNPSSRSYHFIPLLCPGSRDLYRMFRLFGYDARVLYRSIWRIPNFHPERRSDRFDHPRVWGT